ncbi:YggT family protein [Ancylothrix sp. C2]|uniref:YggT family protein n=1 Tax=Ancylothrix sp. D3o TaxID=2953691 RepID=UPI0021BAB6CA|nr:YggT family protein [Ancylothrix sp. D3o]MCT7950244.1 YggT family protein [Ancylothrix sp. D3o]
MSSAVLLLVNALVQFLAIYNVLLVVRILLSWFPNIDFYNPPFSILSQLTDPYLNLFRSLIPPIGGLDFSPFLAFILLNVLQSVIGQIPALLSFPTAGF